MDVLIEVWTDTWQGYGINVSLVYLALIAVAGCAYYNWQKTFLIVWGSLYAWTMYAVLCHDDINLQEDFTIVWLCLYGMFGFFLLGGLIYSNLKG